MRLLTVLSLNFFSLFSPGEPVKSNSAHSEQKHNSFLGKIVATSVLHSFCHLFLLSDNKIDTALLLNFQGRNKVQMCYREQINYCAKLLSVTCKTTKSRVVCLNTIISVILHSNIYYMVKTYQTRSIDKRKKYICSNRMYHRCSLPSSL